MNKAYIEIARLLLESAPAIFETPDFAMKGGTAINLFIDMITGSACSRCRERCHSREHEHEESHASAGGG